MYIPCGIPTSMWLDYFQLQAQMHSDKEVRLREIELGLSRPRARQTESESVSTHRPTARENKFRMLKEEDIDIYIKAFERYAVSNNWPEDQWARTQGKELSGPALEVYTSLSYEEVMDYDTLKNAILAKHEINAETFRKKFRSRNRKPNETVKEYLN